MNYRNDNVYVTAETLFYLGLEARRMVHGTDASVTIDGVCDGLCRKVLTEQNPEWVILWAEMEEAKKAAAKSYLEIERKAVA